MAKFIPTGIKVTEVHQLAFWEAYKIRNYTNRRPNYAYPDPHQEFADRCGISRDEAKNLAYEMIYRNMFIRNNLSHARSYKK